MSSETKKFNFKVRTLLLYVPYLSMTIAYGGIVLTNLNLIDNRLRGQNRSILTYYSVI